MNKKQLKNFEEENLALKKRFKDELKTAVKRSKKESLLLLKSVL